ncbi:uroporphyrinogen-III synthase [Bacillus sp. BRMEA1]|uniref:uroporphyrinogen-III synthase n=1 Tax=Neobacillus endophyticus TaxID=2738405 RepID=UPI001564F4BC|nr:uroporphyrinogen-III synthase [Neobacillus endophyticus]NRD79644.1 uroporphyrinogen-III synthase [Neobacillus endophyticus]
MDKGLIGKKVVICGSRKIEEVSTIIDKQGGIPLIRPMQGTVFLAEKEVEPELVKFMEEGAHWVIFTTSIGLEALLNLAEKLSLKEEFLIRIQEAKVAARGYKTKAALKKLGINPIAVDDDGTTKGLISALENHSFSGNKVMIQLHGEEAPALSSFLKNKGAVIQKLLPYQHIAPEDAVVEQLCHEIKSNQCDAVCFTTATQVHSLFNYARVHTIYEEIVEQFNRNIIAAAIGKVTAEALREVGVDRLLVPENERIGALIIELSQYYKGCQK